MRKPWYERSQVSDTRGILKESEGALGVEFQGTQPGATRACCAGDAVAIGERRLPRGVGLSKGVSGGLETHQSNLSAILGCIAL